MGERKASKRSILSKKLNIPKPVRSRGYSSASVSTSLSADALQEGQKAKKAAGRKSQTVQPSASFGTSANGNDSVKSSIEASSLAL